MLFGTLGTLAAVGNYYLSFYFLKKIYFRVLSAEFNRECLILVNKKEVLLHANSWLCLFIDTALNVSVQGIRFCSLDLQ